MFIFIWLAFEDEWLCTQVEHIQHTQLIDNDGGIILVIRIKLAKSKSIRCIATARMSLSCLLCFLSRSLNLWEFSKEVQLNHTIWMKNKLSSVCIFATKISFGAMIWGSNYTSRFFWVFCTFRTEFCILIFIFHWHGTFVTFPIFSTVPTTRTERKRPQTSK